MKAQYIFAVFSLTATLFSSQSLAQIMDNKWHNHITAKIGFISEDDRDLGTSSGGKQRNGYATLDGQTHYHINPHVSFFAKARGFYATDDINLEPDEGGQPSKSYIEVRQLHFRFNDVIQTGLGALLGRKRLTEESGLWWDRDFTLAELTFDRTLFKSHFSLGQQLTNYRSDGSDYSTKDEDLFRLLASATWQWKYQHFLDFKFTHLNDHSGNANTALTDEKRGVDLRDPKTNWLGINTHGQFQLPNKYSMKYLAAYTYQTGKVVDYTLQNNTISTTTEKDVDAWLAHFEVKFALENKYAPLLGFQFFHTSDNSDDHTEGRFFQTGLESNKSKLAEHNINLTRFNDAFRPELSNLSIIGTFFGIQATSNLEINIVINQFQRVNSDLDIGYSSVNAPLLQGQKDIGVGADTFIAYYPEYSSKYFPESLIRLRISGFWPGNAYGNDVDKQKYRTSIELRVSY